MQDVKRWLVAIVLGIACIVYVVFLVQAGVTSVTRLDGWCSVEIRRTGGHA